MTVPPILLSRATVRERATFTLSRRQQKTFGTFLLVHGLAHAGIGLWAGETGRSWLPISLWELSMVGFLAAGFGAIGVGGLKNFWRPLTLIAGVASVLLLIVTPGPVMVIGLTIDFLTLSLVAYSRNADPQANLAETKRNGWRLTGMVICWAFLLYVAVVLALRPWNTTWGTTSAERGSALPGDEFVPVANYRIDHGITIDAPPEAVWPWLIQIGQDRAGFYSYSKLENAVGAHITNSNRIVTAWQSRHTGDLVPAVSASYLGGALGRPGWKVLKVVSGRALILDGWGAFVLEPVAQNKTRVLIRTRGEGDPTFAGVIGAPFTVLVFEPAHLIME
ncbi:MAG TPA: hypothetical protein VE110_03525, partial [Gemmatimonadaceae bacterium]|nr:hypothetical protein [Gemmatimonadaceae bacterium]